MVAVNSIDDSVVDDQRKISGISKLKILSSTLLGVLMVSVVDKISD